MAPVAPLLLALLVAAPLPPATAPAAAPDRPAAADAAAAIGHAQEVYRSEGPRAALPLFEQARARALADGDQLQAAVVLGLIGNCHKHLGDLDRAEAALEGALAAKRKLGARLEEGKTLSHLGLLAWERGDYPEAVARLEEAREVAVEQGDRRLEAAASNNLALVHDERGQYPRSRPLYERALRLFRDLGDRAAEAAALGNLAGVDYLLGDFRQAMDRNRQALELARAASSLEGQSSALGNLGLSELWLDRVDDALASLDQALAAARQGGLARAEADWLRYRASALLRKGDIGAALRSYGEAQATYQRAGMRKELVETLIDRARVELLVGETLQSRREVEQALALARSLGHPRGVLLALRSLGELERRVGDRAAARRQWELALEQARALPDTTEQAALHLELAALAVEERRFPAAAKDLEAALGIARAGGMGTLAAEALRRQGDAELGEGRPAAALERYDAGLGVAGGLGAPEALWPLHHGRGQALERLGRSDDAVAAYRAAVAEIERVHSRLVDPALRSGYLEERARVYVDLVRLLLGMGQLGEAFGFVERQRAQAYLEVTGARAVTDRHPEERELRGKVERLRQLLEEEPARAATDRRTDPGADPSADVGRELAAAERRYTLLVGELRASDPAYAAEVAVVPVGAAEVQAQLGADEAMIDYFLGGGAVHALVLRRDRLGHAAAPVDGTDLQARVKLLRDRLQVDAGGDWRAPAAALWDLLIAPAESAGLLHGVRRLVVVPHGALHYLPFAVLAGPDGRFLVERYVLSYLPAAGLLRPAGAGGERSSALAFAPEVSGLRFAAEEARAASEPFGRSGHALIGPGASERLCKKRCGDYSVLHFASHSRTDPDNPLFSYVLLEPGGTDDGRLHVFEVRELRLGADLVTLGACTTAVGPGYFRELPAGDDLVSLTRAFLFAGASSVVASLWDVEDRSTTELMRRFYARLGAGDKAGALAAAQRELIARGGPLGRPHAWASFALVGAAR